MQDVIDFTFLLDCLAAGRLVPLRNTYFLSRSSSSGGGGGGGGGGGTDCDLFGLGFDEELDMNGAELERLLGGMDAVVDALRKGAAPSKAKAKAKAKATAGEPEGTGEAQRCRADVCDLDGRSWRDILIQHIHPAMAASAQDSGADQDRDDRDRDRDLRDLVLPAANRLWCGGRLVFFLDHGLGQGQGQGQGEGEGDVLRHRMLLQGATVSDRLDETVSHVVLPPHLMATAAARPELARYRLVSARAVEQIFLGPGPGPGPQGEGAEAEVAAEAALQAIL